ncbi:solute carrier family 25 member 45-like isoform X2 [Ischnura elegans]|uniref:solute carrier family 25 member 45-like isoform X2 n=1 Tax=Ischnura elegans TaxID=197161 RepID=UPI001ED8825B|nr:solute carrier family 25 member 45-like isoform X2 [Ischnura elegans]
MGCGENLSLGSSGLLVGHPMDTVKVRQQTLGISSVFKVIKTTYKYEGFLSFYKGLLFPLLSAGILNSVFFGVYGYSLKNIPRTNEEVPVNSFFTAHGRYHTLRETFLCGCIGGVAQVFITCPVELVKIKMQTETGENVKFGKRQQQNYKSSLECVTEIYKKIGIKGCYKGFYITMLRDVPSSGLYFMVYEKLLSSLTRGNERERVEFFATVFAGGIAGMVSWGSIVPLDVLKSRIQADNFKQPTYTGIYDCFRKSLRSDGWTVFGRGFWVLQLRAFPVNAVCFLTYEGIMCNICNPQCIPNTRD